MDEAEIKKNVHKTYNAIKTVVDLNFQVRKKLFTFFNLSMHFTAGRVAHDYVSVRVGVDFLGINVDL